MLSNTRTSPSKRRLNPKFGFRISRKLFARPLLKSIGLGTGAGVVLNGLDLNHGQEEPGDGDVNGEARELIAGAGAEGAGAACAAEGADQAAAFAALDQDQQDHESAQGEQHDVQSNCEKTPH